MAQVDKTRTREHFIRREQYETYWRTVINDSIHSLLSGLRLAPPATTSRNFELSLITAMGHIPFLDDPVDPSQPRHAPSAYADRFSPVFVALVNRSADFFVLDVTAGDMVGAKLTEVEAKCVSVALHEHDFPSVSKIFLRSLLDLVVVGRYNNIAERAQLIDQFLSYWGMLLLIPQHQKVLEDLSEFMKGRFDDFSDGRRLLPGLTPEKVQAVGAVLKEQQVALSML